MIAAGRRGGVVDAAVHAEAAQRVVDVRGVAGQQHPADAEPLGDPLVHPVDPGVGDRVVAVQFDDALHAPLDRGGVEGGLVRLALRHREQRPPVQRRAQQHEPLGRVCDVVHRRDAGDEGLEVVGGGHDEEPLRVRHAGERDAEVGAQGAVRTVRGDRPAGPAGERSGPVPVRRGGDGGLDRQRDARRPAVRPTGRARRGRRARSASRRGGR
nr:hypothetical protein [Actinomadura sp. CNU-125]